MRRSVVLLAVLTLGVGTVGAQEREEGELSRQVEVSKDYMPAMGQASKKAISPTMSDTVALRPEFDYSIRPAAWMGGFGVAAINPVQINTRVYDPQAPFYLKVGGGFPGQSLLDFYGTSSGRGKGSIGGYVNHRGQYGDIRNDLGQDADAFRTTNSAGLFGKVQWGRFALAGNVGYDYDIYTRYGRYAIDTVSLSDQAVDGRSRVGYSTPHAGLWLGNDFSDLSYFNFRIGAEWYRLSDRSGTSGRSPLAGAWVQSYLTPEDCPRISDYDNIENGWKAFLELGKQFGGKHNITLKAQFSGYSGAGALGASDDFGAGYRDRVLQVSPRYGLTTPKFRLSAGLDYVYDDHAVYGSKSWFFPQFSLAWDATNGYFVPYADIRGELVQNSFRRVTEENPYFSPSLFPYPGVALPPNTAEYHFRAGITGSMSSAFSYHVFAGLSVYRDPFFFANDYRLTGTSEFGFVTDSRMTMFTVGGELEGRVSGSFMLAASAHYYGYKVRHLEHAGSLPNYDAQLELRYNYRDRFALRVGATLIGSRYFYENLFGVESADMASGTIYTIVPDQRIVKQDPTVDLHAEVEYFLSRKLGIFVAGHNLANSKLYYYNHYPERGVQVNAGVKLRF